MSRNNRVIRLPAPYLRRVWLDPEKVKDPDAYPFCLPFLKHFDLAFDAAVTIMIRNASRLRTRVPGTRPAKPNVHGVGSTVCPEPSAHL